MSHTQQFDPGERLDIDSLALYDLKKGKDTLIPFTGIKVLNFWATWCLPCLEEMKSLGDLQYQYPSISVHLLSFEDSIIQRKTMDARQIRLPAFFISDTTVFKEPLAFPRTVILEDNVVINDLYMARNWTSTEIRALMDSLIAEVKK